MLPAAAQSLAKIRAYLDAWVIGHASLKEALLLGLVCREHVLMEGEPGSAKTMVAELCGRVAGLKSDFTQFHRDLRLADLLGQTVLRREIQGSREVIAQGIRPAGLLQAEVAVLDDISRAPGEALNVLLRMLNERKYQDQDLPLISAIATSNPTDDAYFNEPLDPANLDRFLFQIHVRGALTRQDKKEMHQVVDLYHHQAQASLPAREEVNSIGDAPEALARVRLPKDVRRVYLRVLRLLCEDYGCTPENSLLTDRTMLVKTPLALRALALLEGVEVVRMAELRVLRHILSFRIPPEVYAMLDAIIARALLEEGEAASRKMEDADSPSGGEAEEEGQEQAEAQGEEEGQEPGAQAQDIEEILEALEGDEGEKKRAGSQQASENGEEEGQEQLPPPQEVENIQVLLEKIRGRMERHPADMQHHLGGSPRGYRTMRSFEDVADADQSDLFLWMGSPRPELPRTYFRRKKHRGGKVVIVRDVSQSMEGRYAHWTSSIITKLVELAKRKRMRVGYIEFNHISHKFTQQGKFFFRDYQKIIRTAQNVNCSGVTNYQYPLRDALAELKRGGFGPRHILFLTDGEPTQGDWLVREERKEAQLLQVSIHTMFIGITQCPEILDTLSAETQGSCFLATPNAHGGLMIQERENPFAQTSPS